MKQSEGQNGQLPEDARRELGRCGAGNTLFDKELHAYKRLCKEDDNMDESYKILLVSLFMKENQFIVPQKMKRDGKLNEDYDDVREDARKELKEGFETPKKRKGKGLLIHYVDIDVNEVVGKGNKNKNGKEHLFEPEYDREDSEKTIFNQPHKLCSKHHLTCENNEVREEAFELEKKRKGKGLLVEHDDDEDYDDVDENGVEALKERSEQRKDNNAKEYNSEYEILLKLMEEYKQSKKESISKNAPTIKTEEGIVSGKDNMPEPDVEFPKRVPNKVKKPNFGKSLKERSEQRKDNNAKEYNSEYDILLKLMEEYKQSKKESISKNAPTIKTEEGIVSSKDNNPERDVELPTRVPNLVKKPTHPLSDKEHPTRRSRKVIYDEYSSDEDKREEIEKHSSRGIRNVVTKKPRNENKEVDFVKRSCRSRKVNYKDYSSDEDDEGVGVEKRHVCRSRKTTLEELSNKDERGEIEKHSSCKFRNVTTKKPDNEEKRWSRRSRKVNHKECSSDEDVDLGIKKHPTCRSRKDILEEPSDKDQREEIKKHLAREFRNVTMKKPKNRNAEADRKVIFKEYSSDEDEDAGNEKHPACRSKKTIKKYFSRQSRKVIYSEYSSDEDEDGNVDIRIKKRPTHRSRKAVQNKSSDDENTEMLPLKRAAHEYKKAAVKRPSVEDIEEEVKKFRKFLLKKSRYETEGGAPRGHTNFWAGESSKRPKNIDVEILDMDECPNRLREEHIEFRRQVLEVISKPFDKREYKNLQTEFHTRCYPGYHRDLVKKLKKNRGNPRKCLAILRGFFFWLQNLTRQGSFKPWHDRVCLKVKPERPPATGSMRAE